MRSLRLVIALSILFVSTSCKQYDDTPATLCAGGEFAEVLPDVNTLGFTANEVFELIKDNPPTGVTWDELSPTAESAPMTMDILSLEGAVFLLTTDSSDPTCDGFANKLMMNVRVSYNISEGEVKGEGLMSVAAEALELEQIYADGALPEGMASTSHYAAMPAELSGDYQQAAEDYAVSLDSAVTDVSFHPASLAAFPWPNARIGITVTTDAENTSEHVLWLGSWSL